MSQLPRLTDATFEQEVGGSALPILVEFWASWCPPCKMMEPLMDELAEEYRGRVSMAALHVDQNQRAAAIYEIFGVPTFVLFRAGEEVARLIGAQSRSQLEGLLAEVL